MAKIMVDPANRAAYLRTAQQWQEAAEIAEREARNTQSDAPSVGLAAGREEAQHAGKR